MLLSFPRPDICMRLNPKCRTSKALAYGMGPYMPPFSAHGIIRHPNQGPLRQAHLQVIVRGYFHIRLRRAKSPRGDKCERCGRCSIHGILGCRSTACCLAFRHDELL